MVKLYATYVYLSPVFVSVGMNFVSVEYRQLFYPMNALSIENNVNKSRLCHLVCAEKYLDFNYRRYDL